MHTMRHVGIYPGSFDPVHEGHIAFAKAALLAGKLEEVIFLPEKMPRGKPQVSSLTVRLNALRKETTQSERLRVMSLPMERFTVTDTLAILQSKFEDTRLALLVGSDIARTFQHRWPGLGTLLRTTDLIIGLRDKDAPEDIEKLMAFLEVKHGCKITYSILVTPHAHVASSKIRDAAMRESSTATAIADIT